jgi:Holliday junction resolvase RusA-like endonuclease
MEAITYIIKGDPIALARGRYHNRKVYDSQKNEKLCLGITLLNQHKARPLYSGPLQLDVTFYMPIAKSKQKQRNSILDTYHVFTPDLSNMIKFIEDIANSILYDDDCLISKINAKKIYGDPRTEFTITQLS